MQESSPFCYHTTDIVSDSGLAEHKEQNGVLVLETSGGCCSSDSSGISAVFLLCFTILSRVCLSLPFLAFTFPCVCLDTALRMDPLASLATTFHPPPAERPLVNCLFSSLPLIMLPRLRDPLKAHEPFE